MTQKVEIVPRDKCIKTEDGKMKNKRYFTVMIMILAVMFVLSACGTAETIKDDVAATKEPEASIETIPEEDPDNPTPGAAGMQVKNPEEIFRFETTALLGEGGSTINPNGMLLNVGCEDCQDIFYASRSLTVEEVIEKIQTDFGVEEMIFDENFVRFDINIDLVKKLETDLDLIAAKKLTVGHEIVNVRVISIKP